MSGDVVVVVVGAVLVGVGAVVVVVGAVVVVVVRGSPVVLRFGAWQSGKPPRRVPPIFRRVEVVVLRPPGPAGLPVPGRTGVVLPVSLCPRRRCRHPSVDAGCLVGLCIG